MSEDKLSIKNEMAQFDRKNRAFYDSLNEDEKKKFSPYLMIRYGATVEKSNKLNAEENYFLQAYYLTSTNERLNKHFFDISASQHKKLLWLLCTTVSPDMGTQYHSWLAAKKKTTDNKAVKFLREQYPLLKESELKLLAEINDRDNLKRLARELGWDDKRIKAEL
jgi:hypothetical protein